MKDVYDGFRKKHGLPAFEALDAEFEISLIEVFILIASSVLELAAFVAESVSLCHAALDDATIISPALRRKRSATLAPDLLGRAVEAFGQSLQVLAIVSLSPVYAACSTIKSTSAGDGLCCHG